MFATVYLWLKKSAILSICGAIIIFLDVDTRAPWAIPLAIQLLGFAFAAGAIYMAVKKDLANYREFKAEARADLDVALSNNTALRNEINELQSKYNSLKEQLEPQYNRYEHPSRRRTEGR